MDVQNIKDIISENIELAKKGNYRKRIVFDKVLDLVETKHILSLVGVRRCGKSTLMKELVRFALKKTVQKNILYLNLENPFFNQYKSDVYNLQKIYDIFYQNTDKSKKIFVFFDEIQFFSDWQVFVKYLYEKNEAKIILTGSNSKLLSSELATILSGRTISLHVYPFSIEEAKLNFDSYLVNGGFPEVVFDLSLKKELAQMYYKNILYLDVIPRFKIMNVLGMENLSYYLLSNFGKEISYNTLKSISNLDDKTVKQYISYLEDANFLYSIHNYDFSLKKLIGNKKKIYLVDPIFSDISFKNSPDIGRLFENYIFMVLKRFGNDIYFYKNGNECDFLVKTGSKISEVIQVCYELNSLNEKREIEGILSVLNKFKLKKGFIVTKNQKKKIVADSYLIDVIDEKSFRKNSEFIPRINYQHN